MAADEQAPTLPDWATAALFAPPAPAPLAWNGPPAASAPETPAAAPSEAAPSQPAEIEMPDDVVTPEGPTAPSSPAWMNANLASMGMPTDPEPAAAPWTSKLPTNEPAQPSQDATAPVADDKVSPQQFAGDDYSTHPLDNPNRAQGQEQLQKMALTDPVGYEAYKTAREDQDKQAALAKQLEAVKKHNSDLDTDNKAHQAALAQQQQRQAQIDDAVNKLSPTIVPLSTGQKALGVLGSMLGGLTMQYNGGRNAGLDAYEKRVDDNIKTQQWQYEQQKAKLGTQQQSLNQQREAENQNYTQQQIYKAAAFQGLANQLQLEQQNYDPRGQTSLDIADHIQQAVGRMQVAKQAAAQAQFNNDKEKAKIQIDQQKADQEAARDAETARNNKARLALDWAKEAREAAAAKNVNATNPNYSVATGIFDPFTKQPVMGKTKVDAKDLDGQVSSYADEQKDWARMKAIAQRMDNHRGLGGQLADRFRTTDEKEYQAARAKLMATKMRAFGERPNEAAMKAQEDLVPDLNKIGASADVTKIITDAQADNDSHFVGHMNSIGVDGESIVANAQRMRADAPEPKLEDRVTAANEELANAKTPTEKRDAERAVQEAQDVASAEIEAGRQKDAAMGAAAGLAPLPQLNENQPGVPSGYVAATKQYNDAVDTYNQRLRQFHDEWTAKKPNVEKARSLALKVVNAKAAAEKLFEQVKEVPEGYQLDTRF